MWPFKKKTKKTKESKSKKKRRWSQPREEHNFDEHLSDEEFFEIMEDD
ncbi:MAG TPA: hypothetical protein GX010_03775 [Erysipelotrichaceae bacterium]|nr:hypothetical protein [Erysipelotrichaceae bacterium]